MDTYNYTIDFIFNGKDYHNNLSSNQQLFKKPEEGCRPKQSEALFLLEQIKEILSQDELPFLPHDIIVCDENETLFSIPDLKPFL